VARSALVAGLSSNSRNSGVSSTSWDA
jgi:hypothetical protein